MYSYILIKGFSQAITLIDRKKFRVFDINVFSNEIEDITKHILSYYNKEGLVGSMIFKAFIEGDYNNFDLIAKSNDLKDITIPFDLDNYYVVYNGLTPKQRRENIIMYDKENKNRFMYGKKESEMM